MSAVVGGFLVPHVPTLLGGDDLPDEAVREAVVDEYARVAARLADLDATTVVIVGTDHYLLFGPACLPQQVIGIGDVDGPLEPLPGIARGVLPTNEPLAEHIRRHTADAGFDWAVARAMTVDHSIAIPYHLSVRPKGERPVIPVYIACGVEPYIPIVRAAELGAAIRAAVAAHDGDERVVVIGTGGISHSVGTARMGEINEAFDREILDAVERGDLDALVAWSDDDLLREGGNGALEIRTFAFALAAVGGTGRVLAYHAVPEWLTGMGFVELLAPEEVAA